MKRFISALVILAALLIGYWAWPFVGLRAMAVDLQSPDGAALENDIDFGRLRSHLAGQIITTYLRITGREKKLGPLAQAVGVSIIEPWLAQIVTPEKIAELLRGGTVSSELGPLSFNIGEIPNFSLNTAWTAWLASEYGLAHFRIGLPVDLEPAEQFRLRMQLLQWRWRLTGIDLPERLRDQVARELAKKYP